MLKPIGDNILLLPNEKTDKEVGGIIIPDSSKEVPLDSKIIALGSDDFDFSVKVGDHVITAQFAGQEVKYEGNVYKIVKEKDILAIIEE